MKQFVREHQLRLLLVTGVLLLIAIAVTGSKTNTTTYYGRITYQAWGANDKGQLGINESSQADARNHTVQLPGQDITMTLGGLKHSLALTKSGQVFAWGSNQYGQLGNGKTGGSQASPTLVEGLPKIIMIATKQDHNLALDESGHVWAWGLNMSGQLGDQTNNDSNTPQQIKGLNEVTYITSGYRFSIAVKKDGSVWAWGGHCNLSSRSQEIQEDINHELSESYKDPAGGTLEDVTPEDDCRNEQYLNLKSYEPKKIEGIPAISSVSAGYGHVLALTQRGELWTWGCNMYGQTGTGPISKEKAVHKPQRVEGIGKITMVSAGYRHSIALDAKGNVWTWGHNYFGEIGNGTTSNTQVVVRPYRVSKLHNIASIAAGHDFSLALTKNGKVAGWGQASFSQFGDGQNESHRAIPKLLGNIDPVVAISAGGAHIIVASHK